MRASLEVQKTNSHSHPLYVKERRKQMRIKWTSTERGVRAPRGYGFAWYDFEKNIIVGYPIPLNIIFRLCRGLWRRLQFGIQKPDILEAAYRRGYQAGVDAIWLKLDESKGKKGNDYLTMSDDYWGGGGSPERIVFE